MDSVLAFLTNTTVWSNFLFLLTLPVTYAVVPMTPNAGFKKVNTSQIDALSLLFGGVSVVGPSVLFSGYEPQCYFAL